MRGTKPWSQASPVQPSSPPALEPSQPCNPPASSPAGKGGGAEVGGKEGRREGWRVEGCKKNADFFSNAFTIPLLRKHLYSGTTKLPLRFRFGFGWN